MNKNSITGTHIFLNGLFLDQYGKQSGTYFMATSIIRELLAKDSNYILITTEEFEWAKNQTFKVRPFPKKFRFLVESFYRNLSPRNTWVNFDYFLPFRFLARESLDIVVIHDLLPLDVRNSVSRLKKLWFKYQLHRSLKYSTGVIAISDFTAKRIQVHFPERKAKLHVIENPININRFDSKGQQRAENSGQKYFLTVAAPWVHKNLSTLVSAFSVFYKLYQIPLFICGTRSQLLSLNPTDKSVMHLGFVSDEDLGDLIRNSEAFIAPSLYEGFGMTVYEALGQGKFVIASDLEVYKVHPNILRVDKPEVPSSWVASLTNFLTNMPTLESFSLEDFVPDKVAGRYHLVIRETFAQEI